MWKAQNCGKMEEILITIQNRVNDVARSDGAVPLVMHVSRSPGGNPTVEVTVVLLDIPVDVLCKAVTDQSRNRLLDADLSKRCREKCDEKQRSTDEHCDLGGSEQAGCGCSCTHRRSNKHTTWNHIVIGATTLLDPWDTSPQTMQKLGPSVFGPLQILQVAITSCSTQQLI